MTNVELIAQHTLKAHHICVAGHERPDADAVGSVCALVLGLQQAGCHAQGFIGQDAPIGASFMWLPGAHAINLATELPPCDLIITVDCAALSRLGALQKSIVEAKQPVIVLDHHATNQGFGDINLVDAQAESASSIVYDLCQALGVEITPDIVQCLYAGLVADTGGFRWGRPRIHDLAQTLVEHGADIQQINHNLFDAYSLDDMRLIGQVLAALRTEQSTHKSTRSNANIVIACVHHWMIEGHSRDAVESIADYVRGLYGVDLAVVLKEYSPETWTISLRSDSWDVVAVARKCGGGGHVHAAGMTLHGTEQEIIGSIMAAVAAAAETAKL
ncbi:Bifunctional oligoribonuclease and PAP phosphatase NrnA [Corynebacterium diphtheriae]|nr:Bifunctional oligoribonuclease and PAP phosphatase NrnA [Corynebacterium diphtheriae]